jgi:flagellar hook-basal body complex protein FliE
MTLPVGWAAQRLLQYTRDLTAGGAASPMAGGVTGAAESSNGSFGDTLKRAISGVSDAQDNAQANIDAFLNGEPVELHQVMASQEEAGIALQMLVEVRNKFTEAYRTVINMQS